MNNLSFWKPWPKKEAWIYKIVLLLFFFITVAYFVLRYFGQDLVYHWQVFNNIIPIQVPIRLIQTGLTDFFIEGTNFLNLQEYVGSQIHILYLPAVLLAVIFFACVAIILAVATYLKRFWFLVLMGIFIFLMLMVQIGNLDLFGISGKVGFIFALILFLIPAYYFHAIKTHFGLLVRILTMLGISMLFVVIIALFAESQNPFLVFASYGLIPPIILSIIFIILVAHEVIGFFLYIITNNNKEFSKNSSVHFTIISVAYLMLVLLTFLYNIRIINWQLIYLNAFLLLIISAILGIWGFRHRRILYENIFNFQPVGALIYLSLGIICFGTISYFFATANDPAIEAFEDIILFIHLGFGLGFFIYILVNYFTLLHHDQQVYKVLYKPTKMPYFTAQLAGVVASLAFYFLSNQISLNQTIAARYNAIAGYYYSIDQKELAKEYYRLGAIYGYRNHLSNYNLATLYMEEGDEVNAVFHYNEAKMKNPTEHSFVNLSHLYDQNGSYFESLFSLQDGLKRFPNSGVIANNLSLRYNKTNLLDSAIYYAYMAKENRFTKDKALANEFGFYAEKNIKFPTDSLVHVYRNHENLELRTHILAMMNQEYKKIPLSPIPTALNDSLLSINQYAFLQNYLTNQKKSVDQAILDRMENLVENGGSFFAGPLIFAHTIIKYDQNNVFNAMEQLQLLQNGAIDQQSFYAGTLAALALDQMAPRLALDFLNTVEDEESELETRTLELKAIASQMLGNTAALDLIAGYLEEDYRFAAIRKALWTTEISSLDNDTEKYYYLILRDLSIQPAEMVEYFSKFLNKQIAIQAVEYLIKLNLHYHRTEQADAFLEFLQQELDPEDPFIINTQLQILYQQGNFETLFSTLTQVNSEKIHSQDYLLYSALLDLHHERHSEAEPKFYRLAFGNPFFEAGIIEAAKYYENAEDEYLSYNILLQAIRFNQYSEKLYQAYVLNSLNKGLVDYANEGLNQLETLMDPQEFDAFKIRFDSLKQSMAPEW